MTPRIRNLWQSIALNVGAAVLNFVLMVNSFNNGSWLWIMNGVAVSVSSYVAFYLFKRIAEVREEEKARVISILSGKVKHYG